MDAFAAIRTLAFRIVQSPDEEYLRRKLHRWYSKTFHVSIDRAEEIPQEDIWQAYFEEKYEGMSPDELEVEREDILLSDEERTRRIIEAEATDAELYDLGQQAKRLSRAAAAAATSKAPIATVKPLAPIRNVLPEASLPSKQVLPEPPPIKMETVSDADIAAEIAAMEEFGTKKP